MDYSRSGVFELKLPGSRAQSAAPADAGLEIAPGLKLSVRKVSWRSAMSVELPVLVFLAGVILLSIILTPELKPNAFGRYLPFISLSWFRELTGIPCLFCGMTRSFVAMGGMDINQALVFHPLGPAFYGLWTLASLAAGVLFVARRRITLFVGERLRRRITISVVGILIVAWVIKLFVWSYAGLL